MTLQRVLNGVRSFSHFFSCLCALTGNNMATMKANTAQQMTTLRIGISPKTKRTAVRLARDRGVSLNELFIELLKAIIKKQKARNVAQ